MRELPHHRPPAAHWLRAASLWRSLDGHSSELPQAMRKVVAANLQAEWWLDQVDYYSP